MSIEGKVVVITGAANGIGAATARRFAHGGARLLLGDIDIEQGQNIAAELDAAFLTADVRQETQVAALIETAANLHGRIDCMINNAGVIGPTAAICDVSAEEWRNTLAILLDGVFYGIKHAARLMVPQREGCILSTASIAGLGALGPAIYTAAKHGVVGLTRAAASELASFRIRVNAVAPGTVPTPMTGQFFGSVDSARLAAAKATPLGVAIEPEDVAGCFAFLCGRDGFGITGQVITVDAGVTACPRAGARSG